MIQSMTGFGKATSQILTKKITVEIKSLNSKGLDLNVRIPYVYREMELGLRNEIATMLERGKIDFSIFIENATEQSTSKVNVPVVKNYINQLKEILSENNETELLKMAMKMPDALKVEREEIDENDWEAIQKVIKSGLNNIVDFRKAEGQSLEKEFILRIGKIRQLKTL